VPSYDSTGKRLSGGAQRRKSAESNAKRGKLAQLAPALVAGLPGFDRVGGDSDPPFPHPVTIDPPPIGGSVDSGVAWVASVQVAMAGLARRGDDPERVRAVNAITKAVSSLKGPAADSERAIIIAGAYLDIHIDASAETPPQEPAGYSLWAFWQLLGLAHATATQIAEVDEAAVAHAARAYSLIATVQPQGAIDRLTRDAEAAAAAATVPHG